MASPFYVPTMDKKKPLMVQYAEESIATGRKSVVPKTSTAVVKPKVAVKAKPTTSISKPLTPFTPPIADNSSIAADIQDIIANKKPVVKPVATTTTTPQPVSVTTKQPGEGLNMNKAIKVANWINAANAVSAIGMGIYGLNQVDKMEAPNMVSAPIIEAKQIRDSGAQQMASRKSAIATSANTTRDALRRSGRTDLLPAVSAKEMSATNEAAAAIEGLRTNIEAQNVAAENRVREINASSKVNTEQFNAQLQNSFRQFQSQMKNSILNTSIGNVSSNIAGIGQNLYTLAAKKEEDAYKNKALLISSLGQ